MPFTRFPTQPRTNVEIDSYSERSLMSTAVSQEQIEQVVMESLESFGADAVMRLPPFAAMAYQPRPLQR